jgi:dihydroorotase
MGLYVGGTKTNISRTCRAGAAAACARIKIFAGSSTGDLMVEDDEHLEQHHALRTPPHRLSQRGRIPPAGAQADVQKRATPMPVHMEWRDEECAFLGTRRLMALARKTGRPAHILHVSTAEELDYLKDFRDIATLRSAGQPPDAGRARLLRHGCEGFGVMNPPIRGQRHMDAAWKAINDGTVDTIGSDHAPHARAKKLLPWPIARPD